MSLIVDTYNVTHVVGILPPNLAGIDTLGLIRLIVNSRFQREKIILVCDGIPHENAPTGRYGPINIRYAGSNRLADDLINELVRSSSTPKRLTVITLDQAIIREAKKRRCRILGSDDFLRQLAFDFLNQTRSSPLPRPQGPLSSEEIEDWTHHFGLEDDEFAGLAAQSTPESPHPPEPQDSPDSDFTPATNEEAPHPPEATPEAIQDSPAQNIPIIQHLPPELLREAERLMEGETAPESPDTDIPDKKEDTMGD